MHQNIIQEDTLFYNIITATYSENAHVQIDPFCNGLTVVNIGTVGMNVNGVPLSAPPAGASLGEAQTFGGNRREIFRGRIDIAFNAAAGAQALVIQKIYIQDIQKPFEIK